MKKNTWDIMTELAREDVKKRGDYTELAKLKKVERDAEKRMGKEKEKRPEPILKYIDRVKEGGDPFRYQSWNGRSSPDEPNELPKDLQFKNVLPLPPLKPKVKFEPLKHEPMDLDLDLLEEQNEIYHDSVLDKEDVKPKKETGIAGLLKLK